MTRVLFVWSAAEFATYDVARGYRRALSRLPTLAVRDYKLYARMRYHAAALGERIARDLSLLSRQASETIVVEAMRHRADLVLIVSGTSLHPEAIWFLRRGGFRTAVIFTESPYDDEDQRAFHAIYPEMTCFTNERTSAVGGWQYLPHAYDPEIHRPSAPTADQADVLFVGTIWRERARLFEAVRWDGLRPRFLGTWLGDGEAAASPIAAAYEPCCVDNRAVPGLVASAAICLNPHRAHARAESLNPRAYELAACEAFQLADRRAELAEVFGDAVPTYDGTAASLEAAIRHWLARPAERRERAREAARRVAPHTFDARLAHVLASLGVAPAESACRMTA